MIVLGFGDMVYELFDLRTPEKIFNSSFQTESPILDCQISPINNLFSFSHQNSCSVYDFRNPQSEILSFHPSEKKNIPYKIKWIGTDPLIAMANDDGVFNLVNIESKSSQLLKSYNLPVGKIIDLNTTDDTVIITQPNSLYVFQMNTRPLLLKALV